MTNNDEENYEVLLDDVAWSFSEDTFSSIEGFYSELEKYNKELDNEVKQDFTYSIKEKEIKISFDYYIEKNNDWIKVRKSVIVQSKLGMLSELELLYELHNSIHDLFLDYDHQYLEGLELINSTTRPLEYELITGG